MSKKVKVNSWNEWDPLKHVIVGRADGTCIPAPEPALDAKVLASSGIIGTNLGATFLSLIRLVNILTNTIVVDISLSPVDSFILENISCGGVFIGFAKEDLSGKYPPNFILHSFKYLISGEFSFGR